MTMRNLISSWRSCSPPLFPSQSWGARWRIFLLALSLSILSSRPSPAQEEVRPLRLEGITLNGPHPALTENWVTIEVTVGNVPRTGVYGLNAPFNSSIDMSLRREFALHERWKLAIQADAFNINNTVRFGAPATNPDQASFGTITSQANKPRALQLNARITF